MEGEFDGSADDVAHSNASAFRKLPTFQAAIRDVIFTGLGIRPSFAILQTVTSEQASSAFTTG